MCRAWRVGIALMLTLAALAGVVARAQRALEGEKYAVLVGVRVYDPAEPLPTLTYPEDDMDELARVLVASGYKRENIKLMTQREGATRPRFEPTADKIRKELALMLDRLDENDSVVVALAGHGVQFKQDADSFFCPADAVVSVEDEETLINLGELAKTLEACQAGFKLLLVDACRNNPKLAAARVAGRPLVALPSLSRPFARRPPGGVAALFSCSSGQLAFENPDLKRGIFFHFVIQGLQGQADRDGDGKVEVEELALSAKKSVAKFVDDFYGREQTLEFINKTHGVVAIVSRDRPKEPETPESRPTRKVEHQDRRRDPGRARLSVYLGSIPSYNGDTKGVQLADVRKDSPAEKAGLKGATSSSSSAASRSRRS
jgi:uncharacterized caspase-like protein